MTAGMVVAMLALVGAWLLLCVVADVLDALDSTPDPETTDGVQL